MAHMSDPETSENVHLHTQTKPFFRRSHRALNLIYARRRLGTKPLGHVQVVLALKRPYSPPKAIFFNSLSPVFELSMCFEG